MQRRKRLNHRFLVMLVAAASALATAQAAAQSPSADEDSHEPMEETSEKPAAPEIDSQELDWSQLNIDASTLAAGPNAKPRGSAQAPKDAGLAWSSQDRPNGAAAVKVKQPVWSFWDARVGADMDVARAPMAPSGAELLSQKLANGGSLPQSSGTAWAAMTAPGAGSVWDKTAVEARVDPGQEQSKLGTSLSKAVPFTDQASLELEGGYHVTQQGVVPMPGLPGRPLRSHDADQSAKLSINESGTSLIAGQTLSSTDARLLRKIGAEQKLFGGISIKGSIGETNQGATSKSVGIGFNHSW